MRLKFKTQYKDYLLPAIEAILIRESDNAIEKKCQEAVKGKVVSKRNNLTVDMFRKTLPFFHPIRVFAFRETLMFNLNTTPTPKNIFPTSCAEVQQML